ncbi:acyltransferase family protein [Agromyces archimandritae]|uniref:Acyltransferase n=1 Tax=Agromyces archimandritae TaxID=2781962 RepID=A0A975FMN3_9MICO|nr:acyltransferase family protein [Agromyces archimandritae]QTX05250.1 acyltransferase [Agromyces archimandritae]
MPSAPGLPKPQTRRITEIEGLRGISLLLVVAFHLFGHGRVSGGVDVFLFVSGFLLTLSLLRWSHSGSRPGLARRYGRTLLRLVPATLVVLVFVAAMTVLVLPHSVWGPTWREIVASALFMENWELISSRLAYGAAGPETSPLQHFWSLSVQGQFFFVWPAVIAAVVLLARRIRMPAVAAITTLTLAGTAASFWYATAMNGREPIVAYFDSAARFWEIGAGALLAIVFTAIPRLHPTVRTVLGWGGIVLIIGSGFAIDGASAFPGPLALVPLSGAALVILASGEPTRFGADRILSWRPVEWVAGISYPLYLWHWPILIGYLAVRDQASVGAMGAIGVLALSIPAAWATRRWIIDPVLRRRERLSSRRSLLAPIGAIAVIVIAAGAAVAYESRDRPVIAADVQHPGALALAGADAPDGVDAVPALDAAFQDLPGLYSLGCVQNYRDQPEYSEVLVCDTTGDVDGSIEVVLTGGSHAQQWYDAVEQIASENGWRLTVIDKDGCRLTFEADTANQSCAEWGAAAIQIIGDLKPDAVITVSTRTDHHSAAETVSEKEVASWARLTAEGIQVIGIRDTPRFPWRIPECLEKHGDDPESCGRDRAEVFAATSPVQDAAGVPGSMAQLDLSDGFCSETRCEAVVGNTVAYRDDDHMTATYSRTLVPLLEEQLRGAVPGLFR